MSGARDRRSCRHATRRRNRGGRPARHGAGRGVSRRAWADAHGVGRRASGAPIASRRRSPSARGRVVGRRWSRTRSAGRHRGERRRYAARCRARCAARLLLDRLRLRRREAHAVSRVGCAVPPFGIRPHEAAGRGRRRRAGMDRAQLVAVRLDEHELRAHDVAARRGARRGRRRRRPARLPDVRRPSRGGDTRAARQAIWHLASRCGRRVHLGRVRGGDLRRSRHRLSCATHHDGGARPAGGAARVLGVAQRARRRASPATLARGASGVSGALALTLRGSCRRSRRAARP